MFKYILVILFIIFNYLFWWSVNGWIYEVIWDVGNYIFVYSWLFRENDIIIVKGVRYLWKLKYKFCVFYLISYFLF